MSPLRKPGPWVAVVALVSLAAVLYARLIPFSFVWDSQQPLERLTLSPLNMRDIPLNVLLFIPLGFGLAGTMERRQLTGDEPRSAVGRGRFLAMALLLSAALETVQLFMPDRVPSVADVLANGLGAMAGYGLFRAWEMGFGNALDRYATRRNLLTGLGLYLLGAALLTAKLHHSVRLDNWDMTFPLVVGNEAVGKRQWSGRIEMLQLAAGLPDTPDFAARYDFTGEAPFADTGGTAAPALQWRDGPSTAQAGAGVNIGQGEWLATEEAYSGFADAARRFDAFAIQALVSSADPTQRGPARIVSVSADAARRNITLGQERDALIIRLRTPAGGENGQKPEVLIPGVFADRQPRDITVQYDAPLLHVWVDSEDYELSFAPGLAFFPGFATENRWAVAMVGNPHRYDWAYWGLVTGLGVMTFGLLSLGRRWVRRKRHN